ncbi:Uma2 family endonuclease [Thioflexithrix psekupsensis]|uniref:Putative restriction endonuclease domain-containing protein n=1 Tax=Thioflexithrix psekupsensis TaxID=1570016 RepID=A0A251XAA3_9GAMM|nr:Uma2 family endonuclease [Thioflexithrix psekupsensis]OUD15362.1 hypothetical protein TPSD3_02190 [Thioflexithrix psekupsensis]
MQWHEVIEYPSSNYHGRLQMQIGQKLAHYLPHGEVIAECSIQTDDNVKVADLVWASNAFIQDYAYKTLYPKAPEICIEIILPSNSQQEMQQKIKLYLDRGALEVWIIHEDKTIDIYSSHGKIERSQLVANWAEMTI